MTRTTRARTTRPKIVTPGDIAAPLTETPPVSVLQLEQIFNRVGAHLLTQDRKSYDPEWISLRYPGAPNGACLYHGPEGLKCAVGVLIPDEMYHPKIEGRDIHHDDVLDALIAAGVISDAVAEYDGIPLPTYRRVASVRGNRKKLKLLEALREVHDHCIPAAWPGALLRLADEFHLPCNFAITDMGDTP